MSSKCNLDLYLGSADFVPLCTFPMQICPPINLPMRIEFSIMSDAFGGSYIKDFPGGSEGKASVYNARDLGSIPGLGRFPEKGNDNPLQYTCLENPMDWSLAGTITRAQ